MNNVEALKLINKLIHFTEKDIKRGGGEDSERELEELTALRQEFSDAILRDLMGETKPSEEEEEPVLKEYEVAATWSVAGITVIKAHSYSEAQDLAFELKPRDFKMAEASDWVNVKDIEHITSGG